MKDVKDYYKYSYHQESAFSPAIFEHYRVHLKRIWSELNVQKTDTILDLGSGAGYLTKVLTEYGLKVSSLDISDAALIKVREHTPQALVIQGDAEKLPFKDSSFSYFFAFEVLEQLESLERVGLEIKRVCKPGGKLILLQEYRLEDYAHLRKSIGRLLRSLKILKSLPKKAFSTKELHISGKPPKGWLNYLEQIGFEVERVFPLSILPPIYYLIPSLKAHFYKLPVLSSIDRTLCKMNWLANHLALSFIYIAKKK